MNWLTILILAYVAIAVQTGMGPLMRIGGSQSAGAEPNFGLLAMVFVSLYAERRTALIAAVLIGALHDLATHEPFGLFAFSYGLCAMGITAVAPAVYRDHPLTHFSFALFSACVTGAIVWINCRIRDAQIPAVATFGGLLYTSVLAPLIFGIFIRAKRLIR